MTTATSASTSPRATTRSTARCSSRTIVAPAVDLLVELAGDGRALELGIGTGRIAVPLAQRGVPVHGIDLSNAMVARLREKPGAEEIGVTIGDFATARADGTFAVAYLVFNTLMNLRTQPEQVACFRNVAAQLEPGGCFVLEVMVADLQRLPPGETSRAFDLSADHVGLDEYDVATQGLRSHHFTLVDGSWEYTTFPGPLRVAGGARPDGRAGRADACATAGATGTASPSRARAASTSRSGRSRARLDARWFPRPSWSRPSTGSCRKGRAGTSSTRATCSGGAPRAAGAYSRLEGEPEFEQFGLHLVTLAPGEAMAMYHWEADQESFLVLAGEAVLIVEGEERPLRAWDFVHCPPETKHVIVGAGESRCLLVAVGARDKSVGENWGGYTVDETAARHGASVDEDTTEPRRGVREGRRSGSRRAAATTGSSGAASAEGRGVPGAARGRAVRDPEPVGRGLGARCSRRSASRRWRRRARASRSRSGALDGDVDARRGGRARRGARRGHGAAGLGRPRERLRRLGPTTRRAAITRVAEAGAVGGSIEDYDPVEQRIYDFDHAVERVAAAAEAARGARLPVHASPRAPRTTSAATRDLDDTIARLQAFERAGADVLYAPGLRTVDEIRAVCDAVSKPVNVLALPNLSFAEIAEAGAQRVSVGGALTWVAVKAAADAAAAMLAWGLLGARRESPARGLVRRALSAVAVSVPWSQATCGKRRRRKARSSGGVTSR